MPNTDVELYCSSALRYERGRSGSASFADRSRGARRHSRSASRRCKGSARCTGNRAAGTPVPDAALVTVAALHSAHLRIQRHPPDSVERAAPSKCCAFKRASERPGPSGTRARKALPFLCHRGPHARCLLVQRDLDTIRAYSYVASNLTERSSVRQKQSARFFIIMFVHANSPIASNSEAARHVAPKLGWTLNDLAHSLSVSVPFLRLEIKRGRLRVAH